MALYDEYVEALTLAWRKASVRYRNSRKAIRLGRQVIREFAPIDIDAAIDRLPDFWKAIYKAWVIRWNESVGKIARYQDLIPVNANLNTAARGLVIGDELLSGSTVAKGQSEILQRTMHGVLEAHHIIEKGWRTTFPKLMALWPDHLGGDNIMPAINLIQATHRGNAAAISKLAKTDLKDLGLKNSKESVTAVLNKEIILKSKVKPGDTFRLAVEPGVTTEKQFLEALHDVYSLNFPDLYRDGIRAELNKVAQSIGVPVIR